MKHGKTEVFHFSRSWELFNPPSLDFIVLGRPSLLPKDTWWYLGFIFNQKLLFKHYIDFYANRATSTIKCMKILGNSTRGLNPMQKRHLYRCCILSIALYGFQVWLYNKAPLNYPLKILRKMQQRAALWIIGAFKTSPTMGIETIAGLTPIHLHLKKLQQWFHLRGISLPSNHIIKSILSPNETSEFNLLNLSIKLLTDKQILCLNSPLIDMNNTSNEIIPFFSPFNQEFFLGNWLSDIFSN